MFGRLFCCYSVAVVVLCGCSDDVSSGYCSALYLTASDDPLPKWRLLTLPDFYAFSNCSRAGSVVIILKIADDGLNLGTQ